jgi:signal transduction histidine kinase
VVGDLVAEALGELQGLADRAGLELVGDPVPMVVWGDANRLVQALGTLVSNAIEVSPRGGRVVVLAEQRPGEVRLAVVDQGRGAAGPVPAICTRIALAHGGRIWVESAPGRGTAVVLSLPVRRRPR